MFRRERLLDENEAREAAGEAADIDPLADGILMQHQIDWIDDKSDLKIGEKGRRTGITFCEALDDAIIAASKGTAGGDNVFYIGDVKDKALEFVGVCAHFLRTAAQELPVIEQGIFEDFNADTGETKEITAYRVKTAAGFRITGLSSRPSNIRGLQGIVVIDEAAFHGDVKAVIDACNALLIWGGKIRIISTHNGEANPFNDLVNRARRGELPYSVHRTTFKDAVRNGLFMRVCLMRGWEPTWPRFRAWIERIYGSYTSREARDEELFAIPSKGSGIVLTRALIRGCMSADYPVLRLENLPKGFVDWPDTERQSYVDAWLERTVRPHLDGLSPDAKSYLGQDFARSTDLSIIGPAQETKLLKLVIPFIIEMRDVPFQQQWQVLEYVISHLPRFVRAALDARGNGQMIAELARQRFGASRIDSVMANVQWYLEHMAELVSVIEDRSLLMPADEATETDLMQLRRIDGVIRVPAQRTGTAIAKRHGDAAIMLANLVCAWQADALPVEGFCSGERRPADGAFGDDAGGGRRSRGWGTIGGGDVLRGY